MANLLFIEGEDKSGIGKMASGRIRYLICVLYGSGKGKAVINYRFGTDLRKW